MRLPATSSAGDWKDFLIDQKVKSIKRKSYKFSSYQIMIMEKAAQPGNWIKPSMYFDHQQVVNSEGRNVQRFRRITFLLLCDLGVFKPKGRTGKKYILDPKVAKMMAVLY